MIERRYDVPNLTFQQIVDDASTAFATAYADDPRVGLNDAGQGYTVYHDGIEYHVLRTDGQGVGDGWGIFAGPDLEVLHTGRGIPCVDYLTADEAIRDLLGEPCVVANDDGTYTITLAPDGPPGEWTIRGYGYGWVAEHPDGGFPDHPYWASAADATNAVCGDPTTSLRFGEEPQQ